MSRANKKNGYDLETLLSVLGFVFELMRTVVNALRKRGGTIDHLRRFLNEPKLVDQVFDLIVDKTTALVPRAGELIVHVGDAIPSFYALKAEFGPNNVSPIFDGRPFTNHKSCEGIDETPGDRIFLVKHFNRAIKSEEAIAEMDKEGYRPATALEAYWFQKAHPDLQRQFWIIALGSFALGDGDSCGAALGVDSAMRVFDADWFDRRWDADDRFLAVRK